MAAEKVHKTLRLDSSLAERVAALRRGGETDTALYARTIEAGAAALEGGGRSLQAEAEAKPEEGGDSAGTVEAMRETIAILKEDREDLRRQLAEQSEAHRKQLDTLAAITTDAQTIAKQSQTLHAMTETKELGTAEDNKRRRGLLARLFDR